MTNNEATKHIKAAAKLAIDAGYTSDIVDACALAVRALDREAKTGHWIALYDKDGTQTYEECYGAQYKCSICGCEDFKSNYCSNCGAKMQTESEE